MRTSYEKQFIIENYKIKTLKQIALHLGMKERAVKYYVEKFIDQGILTKKVNYNLMNLDPNYIIDEIKKGANAKSLANRFNVRHDSFRHWLIKKKISIRAIKRSMI